MAHRTPEGKSDSEGGTTQSEATARWSRIITGMLCLLALAGWFRLQVDVEVLNLLPSDSDAARGVRLYQRNFLNARELIVAVQGPDAEATSAAVEAISSRLRSPTNRVENLFSEPPWKESPEASAEFLAYLWRNAPPERVVELGESLAPNRLGAKLEAARERIATSLNPEDLFLAPYDPLGFVAIGTQEGTSLQGSDNAFGSSDGTFRLIYVYASDPLQGYEECHAWLGTIRQTLRDALRVAGVSKVETHLTGRPVFVDEIATGMKSDMRSTAPGTLAMIGILFFLAHREFRSLFLLLGALAATLLIAGALGGLIFGTLNVVSLGFAAILLGLAEDFGIVLHQEARSHPRASVIAIRRLAGPGIFWSAVTTGLAFLSLNLSSLPGLRQLGTLVGLGIFVGAWVMLFLFLPLLPRVSIRAQPTKASPKQFSSKAPRAATFLLLAASLAILNWRWPALISSPDVLRPKNSEASQTLKLVQQNMDMPEEPSWLITRADSPDAARQNLVAARPALERAQREGIINGYNVPAHLWPDAEHQRVNETALEGLARRHSELMATILAHGFTSNATVLAERVLHHWETGSKDSTWPKGRVADWLMPRFAVHGPDGWLGLGLIYPGPTFSPGRVLASSQPPEVLVAGWSLLGQDMFRRVMRELPWICGVVGAVVLVSLFFTFRNWPDVALSLGVLAFSGLLLSAVMALLGWSWNLINLMALPLLLGMGVDYSIHMQLALRREGWNAAAVRAGVGRALVLAGSTTIIGFAMLGLSSNLGMASLGAVCALGLSIALFTAIVLLPGWRAPISN